MPQLRPKNQFIFSLILLSLAVGIFWVLQAWSQPIGGDSLIYDQLGKNLCQTKKFTVQFQGQQIPYMSRPPLYPFLISFFYCLGISNPNFIRIFQILLLVTITLFVYFNAKLIFNEKIARLASSLTAIFPPIGYWTSRLHTEIFFIFLLLCASLFLILFFRNKKTHTAIWSGVFFGLATLTRPIFFLFPFYLIFVILLIYKFKLTDLFKKSLILLFFFFLTISPWLIRNYLIFKDLNITDQGGLSYNIAYKVNYYTAQEIKYHILLLFFDSYLTKKIDPSYDYQFSKFEPHTFRRSSNFPTEFGAKWPSNLTEHQEYQQLGKEAKILILKHPIKFIFFSGLELFRIIEPILIEYDTTDLFANTHKGLSENIKMAIIIFLKTIYLVFFAGVIYGIIKGIKNFGLVWPILIIISYYIIFFCLIGSIARYRIILFPYYFIFFSYSIILLAKKIFPKLNLF